MNEAEVEAFHHAIRAVYPHICRWATASLSPLYGVDYAHTALLSLLRRPVLLYEGALYKLWQKRCIDVVRTEQGDRRHPLGKQAVERIYEQESARELLNTKDPSSHLIDVKLDLERYWQTFSPRECYVLRAWATGYNLQDIAQKLAVTPGRISQILRKAAPGYQAFHRKEYTQNQRRVISAEERARMRERLDLVREKGTQARWAKQRLVAQQ